MEDQVHSLILNALKAWTWYASNRSRTRRERFANEESGQGISTLASFRQTRWLRNGTFILNSRTVGKYFGFTLVFWLTAENTSHVVMKTSWKTYSFIFEEIMNEQNSLTCKEQSES